MEAILTFVVKYWAEFILAGVGAFVIAIDDKVIIFF